MGTRPLGHREVTAGGGGVEASLTRLAAKPVPPRRRRRLRPPRLGRCGRRWRGAAAVTSFWAAVLTEIYLCGACSRPEILRRNGRGCARLGTSPRTLCAAAGVRPRRTRQPRARGASRRRSARWSCAGRRHTRRSPRPAPPPNPNAFLTVGKRRRSQQRAIPHVARTVGRDAGLHLPHERDGRRRCQRHG
jgi:hypothetical protein